MVTTRTATRLTDVCTFHGEGPFWDPVGGRLLLVDMLAGAVVQVHADRSTTRHPVDRIAAVIRSRASGGFVVGVERGFRFLDEHLHPVGDAITVFDDPTLRMNEGGCDPLGRFLCGAMAYDQTQGAGTLFRLDADHSVRPVLTDVTISNGLQWSADGRTAFYVDTPTRRIDAFDVDPGDGAFSNRRPFVSLPDSLDGNPDGLAIDADDGLWVALYGGSAVHHYDTAGVLQDVVQVPASHITACAFGGPDLDALFITTSLEGLEPDAEPDAGAVFTVDPGVRGAPLHTYAG
ncbi:SMP-30/gluconolactonase/LRE family protein [uncultured Amnibacterium sp.]|uniref:SMP-30/gluconolactonase/LRE family protein n=1 Tax=uncultured Amnibacterium sp. TaxID=1631851 RepID=UPI0035C984B9